MDVKSWLESTGLKAKEMRFLNPPPYPYIIFNDDKINRGADNLNQILIVEHNLEVELYNDRVDEKVELGIEKLFNHAQIEFSKFREWIEKDAHFQTVYEFTLLEKK